jgi:hypothetical protein
MAEFLVASLDARAFGLIAIIRHALRSENGEILNHWKRRPHAWAAKNSNNLLLEDRVAVGVHRLQRNFGPLKQRLSSRRQLSCPTLPQRCLSIKPSTRRRSGSPNTQRAGYTVCHFRPIHQEFQARTKWSLSNAFTSAFKELDRSRNKATTKLASFLQAVPGS